MSKVFISYSWDSDEHKRWVRRLSDELNNAGIETILDQKDMVLGDLITPFMEQSINKSDFVLLILTPTYKKKADNRASLPSGVGYEEQIMTAEVNELGNHRKYIPVLAAGAWKESKPIWAKDKYGVDFSTEESYKQDLPLLIQTLKGKVGNAPPTITTPPRIIPVKKGGCVVAVGRTDYSRFDDRDGNRCDVSGWSDIVAVSAGYYHTVGLKRDGTVVAVGDKGAGRCNVSGWSDIVAVSAGSYYTVGLKCDGTVVAVGDKGAGRCDVSGWPDITAVSASSYHTVGLKRDGTVVAVGDYYNGQCNVGNWSDIVAVSAGYEYTVGLKRNGTVVAVGSNYYGKCNVSGWSDIVAVSAGSYHTVGLQQDGTVVAVGLNDEGQCNVQDWSDIVAVSAGQLHTVGLKRDGTVVAVGSNKYGKCDVSDWRNITAISAGMNHTVGIVGE